MAVAPLIFSPDPDSLGPSHLKVAGLTAFVAYTLALWPMSIWYRRSWITTIKATVDGLIYALLTAGIFAWLWPH